MTANRAWKGRQFRSFEYKQYEKDVCKLLRPVSVPEGEFCIVLEFGHSNARFDYDNGIKAFQDILQKHYGFDDNKIKKAFISKEKTKKGEEYIWFEFFKDLAIKATA
eukprot:GHVR01065572.1.p2 GENE.GHVR01065572.1~~GHVR01065572.1.p2  ORF type:complete len:107 (+),score=5.26 GHVR01065572.1:1022-1342(+)